MPTVLIVDDEADTVMMLSSGLKLFGYESMMATSGAEALEQIDGRVPDAIVLDLMMPEMDGFEVTRRLRANPGTQSVPIIIATAMAVLDAEDRSREAGATHFLYKPVSLSALADLIRASLKNP